ncbi:MAG TPA: hypothetical protein ENI92_08040 [Bacteroidetes bacterium]|nr:hypothetical protein [Bacteroidota bacterium]
MPAKFGELVVEMELVTEEQLEEALTLQKMGRARLGQIMVHERLLTESQVEEVLTFQKSEKGAGRKFGECAVEMGLINEAQLADAVRYQTTSKGVLGDILIDLGYLTEEQRDEVIREQLMG